MLDKQSPKPLHIQFEDIVRQKIEHEDWCINSIIPSENELGKIYGISRMTVRSVLNRLVSEGLLYRVPGKGTFVAEAKIISQPLSHMGIRKQLERMGYETTTTLLQCEVIPATARVAKNLKLQAGDPVYCIQRIRFVKGVPLSIHYSYIPEQISPGLEDHDLEEHQLCDILEEQYDCQVVRQMETLESVTASPEEAQLLKVRRSFPLLMLENMIYSTGGTPIEYSKVVFRGDKIKLRLEYGQN